MTGEILSDTTVGLRSFATLQPDGTLDPKDLERLGRKTETIKLLSEAFKKTSGGPPEVTIITNDDLPEAGRQVLQRPA